ncbi:hypothetical protein HS1_001131 [Candidatus Desulfofervidus auxilii]|uniref:DUF2007 domain-containing protein n=1 Tax=Desulfofervidus auxilii TaxID=1621989 RepID=A0A7C1VZQ9_DESA2|nr:hypothetical protein [Candidatus Desulfofervidus auxilii]AMM40935.1 hypothetical protein HS1_001131 [Candidatus Desulfofervidus auxilii]CAD7775365.1 hypothetical protein BLFGPEAP_01301 [Candidatus Methanoperedenaceae archaeon GB50]HEC67837.1 hypothetical protein [Candidatus Desulfofervidus auxilii]
MDKVIPFPKQKKEKEEKEWVMVVNTPIEYEAHLICGLLESRHIPYRLQCLKHIPHPVNLGQLGGYTILVPSDWSKIAKNLIEHAQG